jgi:hypothetical protein
MKTIFLTLSGVVASTQAFAVPYCASRAPAASSFIPLAAAAAADDSGEVKSAKQVTGEELEMLMSDWDLPLVVDAYATW